MAQGDVSDCLKDSGTQKKTVASNSRLDSLLYNTRGAIHIDCSVKGQPDLQGVAVLQGKLLGLLRIREESRI